MALELDVPVGAVIVGTDWSAPARRAVDWAVEEADRRGTGLVIIYSPEWTVLGVGGTRPVSVAELTALGERMVQEEVARVREEHPGVPVTGAAVPDGAAVVLVEASRRAALVVVGARGRGPFTSTLLGSVSQKVAAHAHGPVVVVREEAPASMPGPVVVGADPADPPVEALAYAFQEGARRDVAVVVVAAGTPPHAAFLYSPDATTLLARIADEHKEDLGRIVDQLAAAHGVPADVRHLAGHPVDAILAVAGAESLVVVGSRGHSGLANLLLGSVSRGVLHRGIAVAIARVLPG
ncbi:universal stress protein [Georgenia subflava]|nr:universal stress protein [Georgenia subflava]